MMWLIGYVDWKTTDDPAFRQTALRTFTLPYSIAALLDAGQFWGAVLIGILAASVVATEHNWGTVKQALIRGQTRAQYLAVKLAALTLIAAVSLLTALGIGLAFSVLATAVADLPIRFDVRGGPAPEEVPLMVLRAGYGVLPYGLLAFCLAVVGRSTAIGAAGVLVYLIGEGIALAVFRDIGGLAEDSRSLFIGHNVNALIAANRIGQGDYNSMALRENPTASELPDPNAAVLVITVYSLLFLTVAFYVFRQRDIRP
jgi:ABC-type transport system involved in multi-copper enzyme maturation permease subunit